MKITEDVLKELGFVQQNPPHIWDYSLHGGGGVYHYQKDLCRVVKGSHAGKDTFTFQYGKAYPVIVGSVMDLIRVIATNAHYKGVTETQDKLSDALGLDRLLDKFEERLSDRHD